MANDNRAGFLPPTLARMVLAIYRADRALEFPEIAAAAGQRINTFRHLVCRGLIKDIVKKYEPGEPYSGPRDSRYVLTLKGIEAARICAEEDSHVPA